METAEVSLQNPHIILFDGVCNLCSGWVSFVYKRDAAKRFKFVSVQSETGKQLLIWCGLPTDHILTPWYISKMDMLILNRMHFCRL
jgi:predicted DCC family thiol-disulfide oxidoreductase YuxK